VLSWARERAQLGVHVDRTRRVSFVVLRRWSAAVSVSGMIGFVGLIVPHVPGC
jgi:ABC-type Fe3+-siderophore transport system permease subunit